MRAVFIVLVLVFTTGLVLAQSDPNDPGQVATEPADISSQKESMGAAAATLPDVAPGLVQNDDTRALEKAIEQYNRTVYREDPDRFPFINDINERTLSLLGRYQLIDPKNFDLYMNMFLVNNRVYVREEQPEPQPDPEFDATDQNLLGALELSSQNLINERTRGVSDGTPTTTGPYNYRDESIWLRSMQLMYTVPIFPLPMPAKLRGKPVRPPADYLSTLDQ